MTEPTGPETSLVQIHWSDASASSPTTAYFEKEVWSNTATSERVARCSAPDHASQRGLSQV